MGWVSRLLHDRHSLERVPDGADPVVETEAERAAREREETEARMDTTARGAAEIAASVRRRGVWFPPSGGVRW